MSSPADEPTGLPAPVVPPEVYDAGYYETCCAGHEEWRSSGGREMAPVYDQALQRVGLRHGEVVVDIGTGRGELLAAAVHRGAARAVGVEYSADAVGLAQQTLDVHGVADRAEVLLADARSIPLDGGCADLVTFLDVVEHLTPAELDQSLAEASRLLRPGGRIVVHTMPNRTIYDVTYRLLRLGAWRRTWPVDPRNDYERLMHVNEQTVSGLGRTLRRAGFRSVRVRLGGWVYTEFVPSARARLVYKALAKMPPTARLAVSNIWAEGVRP